SLALSLEEPRHAILDARGADDTRVPALDQHRAFGVARVVSGNADRPQLVGAPAGRTWVHRSLIECGRADYNDGGRPQKPGPSLEPHAASATSARSPGARRPASTPAASPRARGSASHPPPANRADAPPRHGAP